MKVNVSREGRFIPKWNGNSDKPESEQLVVEYSNLSYTERRKYESTEKPVMTVSDIEVKTEKELDKEIDKQFASIQLKVDNEENEKIAAAMKPRFLNFTKDDDTPITTWAELLDIPQTPENQIAGLIDEIRTHLVKQAREKDPKNSD